MSPLILSQSGSAARETEALKNSGISPDTPRMKPTCLSGMLRKHPIL